jgi:hypothetical protein
MNSFKTFCESADGKTVRANCIVTQFFKNGTDTSWAYDTDYEYPLTPGVIRSVMNADYSLEKFLAMRRILPDYYPSFLKSISELPADKRPDHLEPANIYGLHLVLDPDDNGNNPIEVIHKFIVLPNIGCRKGAYQSLINSTPPSALANPFINRFKKK